MPEKLFVEALSGGQFQYDPDNLFTEIWDYKDRKVECKIGAEKYELHAPVALMACFDPWILCFIQNDEFRKAISQKQVRHHMAKIIKEEAISAVESRKPLRLNEYQGYMLVRDAIWKYYNGIFFEKTKDKLFSTGKVLEVGCGTGSLCKMIANAFPGLQVVGVELQELPVAYAKEHAGAQNIDYLLGHINKLRPMLEEKYGKFDICISENLPSSVIIDDVLPYLRNGGHYLLTKAMFVNNFNSRYKLRADTEVMPIKIHPWVQRTNDYLYDVEKLE